MGIQKCLPHKLTSDNVATHFSKNSKMKRSSKPMDEEEDRVKRARTNWQHGSKTRTTLGKCEVCADTVQDDVSEETCGYAMVKL